MSETSALDFADRQISRLSEQLSAVSRERDRARADLKNAEAEVRALYRETAQLRHDNLGPVRYGLDHYGLAARPTARTTQTLAFHTRFEDRHIETDRIGEIGQDALRRHLLDLACALVASGLATVEHQTHQNQSRGCTEHVVRVYAHAVTPGGDPVTLIDGHEALDKAAEVINAARHA